MRVEFTELGYRSVTDPNVRIERHQSRQRPIKRISLLLFIQSTKRLIQIANDLEIKDRLQGDLDIYGEFNSLAATVGSVRPWAKKQRYMVMLGRVGKIESDLHASTRQMGR